MPPLWLCSEDLVLRTVYGVGEMYALAVYLDDSGVYPGYLSPLLAVVQLSPGCI